MEGQVAVPLVGGAPLVEATFAARPNRFLVEAVLADGAPAQAHLADRGRLLTQLVPGARLLLGRKPAEGRKTAFQVAGVWVDGQLVSLDTALPNRLFAAAFRARALPRFAGYAHVEPELRHGASRFDFGLAPAPPASGKRHGAAGCPCIVEIKSAADASDGLALFPDAPTSRGRRHLLELADLAETGVRAAVIFAVQRADGRALAVNRPIDPAFAAALEEIAGRGVEIYAYRCPLTPAGIALAEEIPVLLTAEQAAAWRPPAP